MLDCNSIVTLMVTKLKKLHDLASGSDLVDPTMFHQIIGSLMYLVHTSPNICYVVNTLSYFMIELRNIHLVVSKHVIRYLWVIISYGLKYTSSGGVMLNGYIDLDWEISAVD